MKRTVGAVVALVSASFMVGTPATATAATGCGALGAPTVPGADVVSVTAVGKPGGTVAYPPDFPAPPVTDVPPYCDVTAVLTHPGVGDRVTVRLWLPQSGWSGRFQGIGGGGYSMGTWDPLLAEQVKLGYAAVTTDGGVDTNVVDPGKWALDASGNVNSELLRNFASRSLHDMTVAGKALTAEYYGRPASRSYWNGCSTGGRQGLMNAQRYPDDYDGINANAPAANWDRLLVADVWPVVVQHEKRNQLTPCEQDAFEKAALDACDKLDGVADRVISDPRACRYDPHDLVGTKIGCDGEELVISRTDADVVQAIWDGPRGWYGFNRGTELSRVAGPAPFEIASSWVRYFVRRDPGFDVTTMSYGQYYRAFAQSRARYDSIIGTDDPDLTAFRASGGKMITWHGTDDSVIPYQGTVDYRDRVGRRMGGVDDFYRVFLAPGVDHCAGGLGAAPVDPMAALVDWVERGRAPRTLPARTADGRATRDLCLYPLVPRYRGGDPDVAASFTCLRS